MAVPFHLSFLHAALLLVPIVTAWNACGDEPRSQGELGGICYPNGTCNVGLVCTSGLCIGEDFGDRDTSTDESDTSTDSNGHSRDTNTTECPITAPTSFCGVAATCSGDLIGEWDLVPCTAPPAVALQFGSAITSFTPSGPQPGFVETGKIRFLSDSTFFLTWSLSGYVLFPTSWDHERCGGSSDPRSSGADTIYRTFTCSWDDSSASCTCVGHVESLSETQSGMWQEVGNFLTLNDELYTYCAEGGVLVFDRDDHAALPPIKAFIRAGCAIR